ncbi:ATP-dependent nuclease [Clostridium formicaceticum]|uniref:Chromosome partition protein Smc n=1 Tax=Clostridium formicaceticum TaxID=1497 RepID=A0AAC9RPN2_9CLOT|nr:AAA family ATPase [Clostridium formicaceticum]AOY75361.1 hypothetical protein BJL90_05280 [Clostridium formicaceticum]ARE89816.1 Chromosome partition protein Smc [Clostridium formicaceticum]
MYIKRLRIKNYKSFLDSGEIEVKKDIFAFIGQNNTGKSAILDSIQVFFPKCKKTIAGGDFHKNTTEDINIEICFGGVDEDYLASTVYNDKIEKQNIKIKELFKKYENEQDEKILSQIQKQQEKLDELKSTEYSSAVDKYKIYDDELYINMVASKGGKITKKYYNKQDEELKDADLNKILPEIKVIPALRDPKTESTAGNNSYLKDLIQMLDEESKTNITLEGNILSYNEINEVLSEETKRRCNSLAESITSYYNQAVGGNEFKVVIDASVNISKGTTYYTTITDQTTGISNDILNCGTGYQSMIILSILETYVQISQSQTQYILLIEEPEVYLHPELQRRMIDTLIRISDNNQVVFTSHSPITVSKLAGDNIKLVEKQNGEARILCISPKKIINELGIKPDDILYYKGIIFVEGKDDYEVVVSLINKIDNNLIDKINVIQAHSCQNLKFYANAELLMNINFNIPVLILRDSDVKDPNVLKESLYGEIAATLLEEPQFLDFEEEELTNKKDKLKSSIYVLLEHSIEYYFIEDKFLYEFASDLEELNCAIECYECQYRKQLREALNGNNQVNNFEAYFQPKRFLKGYPDAKERDREYKEKSFKDRWERLSDDCQCENKYKIDNYLKVRDEIIENVKRIYISENSFFKYIINKHSLDILKESKLNEVIQLVQGLIDEIRN